MCFRTGFLSFPKSLSRFQVFGKTFSGGLPIDGLITNLFETAYVHRAIAHSRLRWFVSDFVIKRVLWFLTGTQAGMNQHVGGLPQERLGRAFVFLNKSNKAMPYLNRPYQKHNPILACIGNRYIDPPEDANSNRVVDTCTWPEYIDDSGRVHFQANPQRKDWQRLKNRVIKPDCVVYCSGSVFPPRPCIARANTVTGTSKPSPTSTVHILPHQTPKFATSSTHRTRILPSSDSSAQASELSRQSPSNKPCGGQLSSPAKWPCQQTPPTITS